MRKFLFFAIVLILAVACETKEERTDNKIKTVIEKYVQTDFDDPDVFLGIAKCEYRDTLNYKSLEYAFNSIFKIPEWYLNEDEKEKREWLKTYSEDMKDVFKVVHTIRIRVLDDDGEKRLKKVAVIEDGDKFTVSDIRINSLDLIDDRIFDLLEVKENYEKEHGKL